jgi:hypothetical protein
MNSVRYNDAKAEIVMTVIALILLVIIATSPHASADRVNPGVSSINSRPYGFSYAEWSMKWWQWLVQIPSKMNPINDKTGANCAQGQSGPVWFTAGSNQGPAVRDCTVPMGKAIAFFPLTFECSYAEDSTLTTEAQLRSCAANGIQGGLPQVSVDGVNFRSVDMYRVQSPLFNLTFPTDNIFGAHSGPTQAVSDGWFIILQPLAPGIHTVHASGAVLGNPSLGTQGFATDATYHLTVR